MISEYSSNKENDQDGSNLPLKERFNQLKKLVKLSPVIIDNKSINCELLFDVLNALYYESQRLIITSRNKQQQKFADFIRPYFNKLKALQLNANDFEQLKTIGRGAFGQVSLVKAKENGNIYAMKTLSKIEMLRRAETSFYREERDILLHGSKDWFTKLHFAFQDELNLYLIMTYYIGGDLLTLISKYDDGLPESMCIFYCTEIILALTHLHSMKYIHRDVKPDNILLDSKGHCVLADFGSCIKYDLLTTNGQCMVAVGTPDYIAPEMLNAMEGSKSSNKNRSNNSNNQENDKPPYSYEVDFWSLGCVLFELLTGNTPFYAESLIETYSKIINFAHSFEFPKENISDNAKDLIKNLICDQKTRFKNLEQFQDHEFFKGIDWENIRNEEAPYIPIINGPEDTSNFDCDDIEEIKQERSANNNQNNLANAFSSTSKDSLLNLHLPFIGYTCTFTLDQVKENPLIDNQTLDSLLSLGFHESNSQSNQSNISDLNQQQFNSKKLSSSPDTNNKITNLEKELLAIRQDRNELSSKLIEIRNEKAMIVSKLKSKEEEFEYQIEKTSEIRQQLQNAERLKRQHLETIINLETALDKEKQLRKENQYEVKELEEKMAVVEEQLINYQSINAMKEDDKFEKENSYVEQISDLKFQLNEKLHNLNEKQEVIKDLQHKLFDTEQRLVEHEKLINLNQKQEKKITELENELEELKQTQSKWEKQISEIISWVGSEKEARSYLQEIAINMTKELEGLKQQKQFQQNQYSNVRYNSQDKYATLSNKSNINDNNNKNQQESDYSTIMWKERRSARVDKSGVIEL